MSLRRRLSSYSHRASDDDRGFELDDTTLPGSGNEEDIDACLDLIGTVPSIAGTNGVHILKSFVRTLTPRSACRLR